LLISVYYRFVLYRSGIIANSCTQSLYLDGWKYVNQHSRLDAIAFLHKSLVQKSSGNHVACTGLYASIGK